VLDAESLAKLNERYVMREHVRGPLGSALFGGSANVPGELEFSPACPQPIEEPIDRSFGPSIDERVREGDP
jgi:hypothetical protein